MNNYLIANYLIETSFVKQMDNALKRHGFSHKKTTGNTTLYSNVILKISDAYGTDFDTDLINEASDVVYSILDDQDLIDNVSIELVKVIQLQDLGVSYFDGSYAKGKTSGCGIVCRDISPNGVYESFTDQKYNITHKAELVADQGTNNIGELHGLKYVLDQITDKPYQLIIGDSEYVIKSFREWIFGWEKKNWKSSTGKTVLNLELIQEIYNMLNTSKSTIIFKWTKGHNEDSMNEMCDKFCGELTQGL